MADSLSESCNGSPACPNAEPINSVVPIRPNQELHDLVLRYLGKEIAYNVYRSPKCLCGRRRFVCR